MQDLIIQYYAWLSGLTSWLVLPLRDLADSINLPLVSALLFGLIGATAPCQLSTNAVALAFVSRKAVKPGRIWGQMAAFIAGKITVYSLVGGAMVLLGLGIYQINDTAIPILMFARRALGPLLILAGLFMVGVFNLPGSMGGRLSTWLEAKARGKQGLLPAYLLGLAFSFTFCPTLFWLFFGLTIPLAIASAGGLLFPGVFAVGTALPLLGLAALVASGTVNMGTFLQRFKAADQWIQRIVGGIFVLVGLHEIVLYWMLG